MFSIVEGHLSTTTNGSFSGEEGPSRPFRTPNQILTFAVFMTARMAMSRGCLRAARLCVVISVNGTRKEINTKHVRPTQSSLGGRPL
jgi:hypothetical protein